MPHAIHRGDATVTEAAAALDYTERTIYRKIHDGELPARRVGNRYLITWDDLAALGGEVTPPDPLREAPKLSAEQLDKICALLRGVA